MKAKNILVLAAAVTVTFSFTLFGLKERGSRPEAPTVKAAPAQGEPAGGFYAEDKF
jgi:hypothetical protein